MKISKTLILLPIFFISISICGMEDIRIEHIDSRSGLSHNTVRCILQDSRGLIWIGAMNGMNRYDGHKFISIYPEFSPLSLLENNIRMMVEDKNGCIWVQTSSRFVNCYDLKKEAFIDYSGQNLVKRYRAIKIMPNGDVWLWGTDNGLCIVHHTKNGLVSEVYDTSNIATNSINTALSDSKGRLWIGTPDGLVIINNKTEQISKSGVIKDAVENIFEINEKIYILTTNSKISVYDLRNDRFLPEIDYSSLNNNQNINQSEYIGNGNILIAGKENAFILNTETQKVNSVIIKNNYHEKIQDAYIRKDNKDNCWLFNRSGNVWRYIAANGNFERFNLIPEPILSVIDHERYDIFVDSRETTWISTYGNGLFAIEANATISHFTCVNSDLRTNYLLFVTEDKTRNIWLGTENAGIAKLSFTEYRNNLFTPSPLKTESQETTIRSIFEDIDKDLWIGTRNGDIFLCDSAMTQTRVLTTKQKGIYVINSDSQGNIWMGTKGNGLLIFPTYEKKSGNYQTHLLSNKKNAGENNIYAILKDSKGRMWVGTFGNGLFLCEWKDGKLTTRFFPDLSKKQRQIRHLIQDHSGRIWAGGENGIVIFSPDELLNNEKSFKWYYFDKNNPKSLNNNIIKVILEDKKQRVWIGTSGGGLNLAVKNAKSDDFEFQHYTAENGLTNNVVQGLLEDENGHLWISTESGLSKFNIRENLFENFNFLDTWKSDYFCESVALKRKDKTLLFGNFNGIFIINPSTFKKGSYLHPVVLTGLTINGIPASPNTSESPLQESITGVSNITLKHIQNSFGIEFSSLNYQSSYSNRYTYILEGYDKEWNPVTQYNVATYKNIPPGKYTFRVKCTNDPYTMDQTETSLEITVKPPFWKSYQAIILYIILGILLLFISIRIMIKMNKLHNEVIIEKQLTDFRLRFFTNISHEFRTPLTIILGSIESMGEMSLSSPLKHQLSILEKSTSKLMRLIDQLLEFRKVQNDQMDLRLESTEVIHFVAGIFDFFTESAKKKQINFTFNHNIDSYYTLIDRGKIEKIIFNLLSNAFKHTPDKGNIELSIDIDTDSNVLNLSVSDSGIGIPPEKQHLLFVRFKQINYTTAGIGIGLNLTSELVRIHLGTISYEESRWKGACFKVSIPTDPESYDPVDIIHETKSGETTSNKQLSTQNTIVDTNDEFVIHSDIISARTYNILVIEDDEEILSFLRDVLSSSFAVTTAENGKEGWKMATDNQPDLIVCDVMMPEMDGFEVTKKLKTDFETSHIPIILLTAHSSIEHQLEGINAGADAYIIKPFSTKYLISRIVKLIEQREKLHHKFAHEPRMVQPTISASKKDIQFIEKIHAIINKHLSDPDFSVDDFAREANMSRTLFFKKIKGLTNYSPNEYFRIIRLKKASELLLNSELNISEIAYEVGFNDPDYFSKCFKEQFEISPKQYRNKS